MNNVASLRRRLNYLARCRRSCQVRPNRPYDSLSVLCFILNTCAVNAASQYEKDFSPTRLCNWEKPSERCTASGATSSSPAVGQHKGRTKFVVDDRGYLVGPKRPKSAFNLQLEERLKTAPRWPQVCHTYQYSMHGHGGVCPRQ